MVQASSTAEPYYSTKSSAIKNLIQYIVRRGILVTLIQTLLLVTFHAAPGQLIW